MQITLTEGQSFFFIKEAGIHLSFASPGPITVDWDTLPPDPKRQIINAVNTRVISVDKLPQSAAPTPKKTTPAASPAIDLDKIMNDKKVQYLKKAKEIVTANLQVAKKHISVIEDTRLLNLVRDAEKTGKNRKGVLKVIDTQIEKVNQQVANSIISELPNKDAVKLAEEIDQKSLPNVDETDVKTVTFTLRPGVLEE